MLKGQWLEGKGKKCQKILDSSGSESDSTDERNQVQDKTKDPKKSGKGNGELTINKGYAERYDNWRNLEEMQKLKNRLGINDISELKGDSSSSESSSEEEVEWSHENEKAFLKTYACLKTKNPKIYNDKFGYFKNVDDASTNDAAGSQEAVRKKKDDKKPFTVRDHERTMILEKAGQDDDQDSEDDGGSNKKQKSYPEELASIKTAFSKALNDIDSSDEEGGDNLLGSNLLKRRSSKSVEERQRDDDEYKLWLKGELEKVDEAKMSKDDVKELKSLRKYWNDDKLDDGEKFLRDYILNKNYIEPLKGGKDYIPSYNEVVHDDDDLSNDEKFEEEREEFEHKYNFRFEEPDQDFVKRYPRTIQESMRREDTKRKEQRQKVKDRKEELKARKKEEVQRLKALKRKEIMDKIQKLHEISGDPNLNLSEVDIDGDFDPEEYDRRMQKIFSDDYYQEGADDEKPVFDYDPAIDDEEPWEDWVPARGDDEAIKSKPRETGSDDDEDEEDSADHKKEAVEFFGREGRRAAAQQELIEASKGKRFRKKRSVFLDALEREKPKFDPKHHKSFEKYFEEYYNLDFEDVIDDVKCRFKYHKTTPNDFGLSTEEILKAEDKELNQWASLKKTFQYRGDEEERYEVKAYKKKAENEGLKKRVLPSVYQPVTEKNEDDEDDEGEDEKQKKKRKKKNKKKNKEEGSSGKMDSETSGVNDASSKKSAQNVNPSTANVRKEEIKVKTKSQSVERVSSQPSSEATDNPSAPKLSKRQRKNRKRLSQPENAGDSKVAQPVKPKNPSPEENGNSGKSKKKRNFENENRGVKRKAPNSKGNEIMVDEDRLRSYGLNPTKFKKQMKYGSSSTKA